jgi:hypothetical protein
MTYPGCTTKVDEAFTIVSDIRENSLGQGHSLRD